jgi:hypothetical protein
LSVVSPSSSMLSSEVLFSDCSLFLLTLSDNNNENSQLWIWKL